MGVVASWLEPSIPDRAVQVGLGHCPVFLGKTLYSHNPSIQPGVQMGNDKYNAGDGPAMD